MIFFMSRRNTGFSSISISIILIITVMNTKGLELLVEGQERIICISTLGLKVKEVTVML